MELPRLIDADWNRLTAQLFIAPYWFENSVWCE